MENQNFSTEVKSQNKMLEKLNVEMDDAHEHMLKVDNKLKQIIANTSQCKLWMIVIAEIILLALIILF